VIIFVGTTRVIALTQIRSVLQHHNYWRGWNHLVDSKTFVCGQENGQF
jgi:hypothetical protein